MRPPALPTLEMPLPRRPATRAFGLALILHLLLVGFLLTDAGREWTRSLAAPPPRATRGGGGGGGGREHAVAYISLSAPPAARPVAAFPRPHSVASRPEPVPPVSPPVAPERIDTAVPPPAAPAGAGEGAGPVAGSGSGPGTGGGEGGGAGGGTGVGAGNGGGGREGVGPEPRQLVLPPADYPKDMRGRQVAVTFYVAADGRVDRIEVEPAIRDGGFARRFEEAMRNYRFRPARSPEGRPVPGTTTVTVFF